MPPPDRDLDQDDPLEDFEARELSFLGQTKQVFVSGTGPAVIVMAEMPGIYPHVSRFARWAGRLPCGRRHDRGCLLRPLPARGALRARARGARPNLV